MKISSLPTPGVSRDPYQDGLAGIYRQDLRGDEWQRNQQGLHDRDKRLQADIDDMKSYGLTREWPKPRKED